jgi:hypothetical protein
MCPCRAIQPKRSRPPEPRPRQLTRPAHRPPSSQDRQQREEHASPHEPPNASCRTVSSAYGPPRRVRRVESRRIESDPLCGLGDLGLTLDVCSTGRPSICRLAVDTQSSADDRVAYLRPAEQLPIVIAGALDGNPTAPHQRDHEARRGDPTILVGRTPIGRGRRTETRIPLSRFPVSVGVERVAPRSRPMSRAAVDAALDTFALVLRERHPDVVAVPLRTAGADGAVIAPAAGQVIRPFAAPQKPEKRRPVLDWNASVSPLDYRRARQGARDGLRGEIGRSS